MDMGMDMDKDMNTDMDMNIRNMPSMWAKSKYSF
jgi:hypothetical protein